MEGLTTVAATPVPFEWKGKQYMLGRMSIADWAAMEDAYIRRKRQRIIMKAKDLRPLLSDDEYQELYRRQLSEAMSINEASNEELQEFIWGPSKRPDESDDEYKQRMTDHTKTDVFGKGISFMLSVVLDRRYPGEFKQADVLDMITKNVISGSQFDDFMLDMQKLQGSEGNQDGEGIDRTEPQPNPQASGQDSAGG